MAVNTGNSIFLTGGYDEAMNGVAGADGRSYRSYVARAKLTGELQNNIPLILNRNSPNNDVVNFTRPLKLPINSWITRIDFRLPTRKRDGSEKIFGLELPDGTNIEGTTGEKLKVSFDNAVINPSPAVAAANSQYAPNSTAILFRPPWQEDQPAPSMLRQVTNNDGNLKLVVTDAGDTALGNGIKLSTNTTAYVYVLVVVMEVGRAITPWNHELPPVPLDFDLDLSHKDHVNI